jgi:hypothetical protein
VEKNGFVIMIKRPNADNFPSTLGKPPHSKIISGKITPKTTKQSK